MLFRSRATATSSTRSSAGPSAPQRRLLDTSRSIGTPEGIELTLRLAGPVPRALAWLIDFAIRVGALIVFAMVIGPFGNLGQAAFLLAWFLLEWLFPAWCEVQWNGQTPGKKALGIAVLNDDGTPVRWPAALARNLLRAVDFLPFFYGFGLAAMLINRDFKRLGDLAANTLVAYRDVDRKSTRLNSSHSSVSRMPSSA